MEAIDIPESNFREIIVIGGGPSSLAITSRLCESTPGAIFSNGEHSRFHWLRQRGNRTNVTNSKSRPIGTQFRAADIMVLDKTGEGFMQQWHNQFDAVKIPHLRSPMFFHPDPTDIDALVAFAYANGREDELMEIHGVVGKEISKHRQKKMRNKRKLSTGSTGGSGLVEIDRRDWKDYYRPGAKLFADFCKTVVDRYNLHGVARKGNVVNIKYTLVNKISRNGTEAGMGFLVETEDGDCYGCRVCISAMGPGGKVNYPINGLESHYPEGSCHTTHLFQKKVEFPPQSVVDKSSKEFTEIAIVGGGLTSAQLTELALKKGVNRVHFITRGEIKIKHFDFHLEWVSKYQNYMKSTFWMKDTDLERHQMIEDAREGGSMNPQYHKILMDLIKSGKVVLHKHCEIRENSWDDERQLWGEICLTNKLTGGSVKLENIDYICFATGTTPSLPAEPMMKSMIHDYPIDVLKGFPCLTDDLQWNSEVPFFMLGRYAMLKTGPSSANLDGGRLGAERIGWFVQNMRERGLLKSRGTVQSDTVSESKTTSAASEKDAIITTHNGFDQLLKCTGGRCNWFDVLSDTALDVS